MADTETCDGRYATAALAFVLPAVAFAALFSFRYVDEPDVDAVRTDLIIVAVSAAAAALAGVRQAGHAVPELGRAAAVTLVIVDAMIAIGATVGIGSITRGHPPYLVGWIIDIAALLGVCAAVRCVQRSRRRRA